MKKLIPLVAVLCISFLLSNCKDRKKEVVIKITKDSTITNDDKKQCMAPLTSADSAKFTSKEILVNGEVEHILHLTVDSLKQMQSVEVDNYQVVCESATSGNPGFTCKGVLLRDILDKAQLKKQGHKDRNFYIVVRATDGYKATFSWAELFNNPTGANTLVIFEENGKAIGTKGDMVLICRTDIKTAPRHVIWVKQIEVFRVN